MEHVAGVASSIPTRWCRGGGISARTDQPVLDEFVQAVIDQFERRDACRSDGACNEACNRNGQLGDADCAAAHCARDGVCALACVAPVDPDCVVPTRGR